MAITYGFFDSVSNDRVYNADQMSRMFKGLISDGIFENVGERFVLTPGSGLTVKLGTGRAMVDDKWIENDDNTYSVSLNSPHPIMDRYTAIVLRKNIPDRVVVATTIDGTPNTTPTYPAIVRNENYYDICLGYVLVKAAATSIAQEDIIDTRTDTSICGWVTGLIEQVDTSDLFLQYLSAYQTMLNDMTTWFAGEKNSFDTWFNSLTQELVVNLEVAKSKAVIETDSDTSSITFNISTHATSDTYIYHEGSFEYIDANNVANLCELYINGLYVDPYLYNISYSNNVITLNTNSTATGYSGLRTPIGTLDEGSIITIIYTSRKVAL